VERPPLSCYGCGEGFRACDDEHHCPHDYNCEAHCCVAPPPECVDGADCNDPAGDCKKAECKGGVCVTTADNSDVPAEGAVPVITATELTCSMHCSISHDRRRRGGDRLLVRAKRHFRLEWSMLTLGHIVYVCRLLPEL
jgi:hypothetical protein